MNECSLCVLLVIASQKERLAHRMLQEVWTIIIIIVSSDSLILCIPSFQSFLFSLDVRRSNAILFFNYHCVSG